MYPVHEAFNIDSKKHAAQSELSWETRRDPVSCCVVAWLHREHVERDRVYFFMCSRMLVIAFVFPKFLLCWHDHCVTRS